jgi:uncharacterized membrane protein (UPF0127 family)
MLSLREQDIMARIHKRAAMLKEISCAMKPVAVIEPEQSWNEYRTIGGEKCRVKAAQTDPVTLGDALVKGRELLGGAPPEDPGWIARTKTKLIIDMAKRRLRKGDYDVKMQSGLNRVKLPKWGVNEAALPYVGFKPSLVAIPERGQESMMTYRDPKEYFHIHRHPKRWFMHMDKYPSVSQAKDRVAEVKPGPIEAVKTMGKGVAHVVTEGIPGLYYYLANLLTASPTLEEMSNGARELPPMLAARVESPMGKKAELVVEVAHTEAEMAKGLSGRPRIPDDYGMLFTKAGAYWMKGVPFDLDIMFLDKRGCVLDMTTMRALRKGEYPEIYSSKSAEAALAVEVPAGWCARRGVQPGDKITLDTAGS